MIHRTRLMRKVQNTKSEDMHHEVQAKLRDGKAEWYTFDEVFAD